MKHTSFGAEYEALLNEDWPTFTIPYTPECMKPMYDSLVLDNGRNN